MARIHRWCRIDRRGCVCCASDQFEQQRIVDDDLARTWELSARERRRIDAREGHLCRNCRMSRRVRMLLWSLRRVAPNFAPLEILHFNKVNELSQALAGAATLVETAFLPERTAGEIVAGLVNQDMTRLTFESNRFDLVVHSETLEHLDDYERALGEAHRVLKPNGHQVYTLPLLHGRRTRRRLGRTAAGARIELLPPSYHGCDGEYPVVWEFGGDFLAERWDRIDQIHYDNYWRNRSVFAVIEKK